MTITAVLMGEFIQKLYYFIFNIIANNLCNLCPKSLKSDLSLAPFPDMLWHGIWFDFWCFNTTFSYIMATSFSGGRSQSTWREPPTMCCGMGDQRKLHYGSYVSDLYVMIWWIRFSANRIAHSMQSSLVTSSYSRNRQFHWLVHRVNRMWPVLIFLQIFHTTTISVIRSKWEFRYDINEIDLQNVTITTD